MKRVSIRVEDTTTNLVTEGVFSVEGDLIPAELEEFIDDHIGERPSPAKEEKR